jgi:hypothetical protein
MAFTLNSRIKIGKYFFPGSINECTIKKNVGVIMDTATLKIPGKCMVVSIPEAIANGLAAFGLSHGTQPKPVKPFETARLFKEGDKVSIDLGYNGDLRNEFTGFVRRVNLTTPVSLELEGYAWQLRQQNILASWKTVTLRQILERVIQGTDIVLSPDIPLVNLTNFYIKNDNGLKVLEYLKEKMLLTVYFDGNELYAGLEEGRKTAVNDLKGSLLAAVKYHIGYNCITNQPDLKQRLGSDNQVHVQLTVKQKTGKKVLFDAGDTGGAMYQTNIPFIGDTNFLRPLAAQRLKSLKYDGYQGGLKCFLQPFCKPGWKAVIKDEKYDGARAGTYFIQGTEVKFGVRGATRNVQLTYRLDGGATQLINQ